MDKTDLSSLLPALHALSRQAGSAILAVYREAGSSGESPLVALKADSSPLTRADLAAHQVIAGGLRQITPDIPVVSEEDAGSLRYRLPASRFWLVDPLDGTKEFLARNGEFTVNIALIEDGLSVWGMVHTPVLAQTHWGGAGLGAWREDGDGCSALHVSDWPKAPALVRVLASKHHLNASTQAFIEELGPSALLQAGSSLKFCRIAEGQADIYPRMAPTCEWDTAAAQAVLEGAGGHVFDTTGGPLCYGKPDVLNPDFIASSVPFTQLPRPIQG